MGIIRKDFKYKVIKNFISFDEQKLIENYLKIKHRTNNKLFSDGINQARDSSWYADPLTEALMLKKTKEMEKITGLELLPTYSYSRFYTYLANLIKHKDRESCEISVTVQVGSSGEPWPIFVDGNKHILENGDAVVYLGCELEHYREEFQGDFHIQCFLHWVDKNGKNKDFALDKRNYWGLPPILNV
jgi:hypothetical protein